MHAEKLLRLTKTKENREPFRLFSTVLKLCTLNSGYPPAFNRSTSSHRKVRFPPLSHPLQAHLFPRTDSLFEAAVSIPLSSSLSDTRTFRVPPVFSSPSHARTGAAEAALKAGALDLLESRTRVAVLKSTAPTQREGDRGRGRKRYVPVERSLVEQEEVHQKTYGGFGEAMAVAAGLQKKKGKSVLALEGAFPSSLPLSFRPPY